MNSNFFVSPQQNEIIETTIHISESTKPALIGSVLDHNNKPIKDAFLALYEVDKKDHKQKNLAFFTYTDEWGSFVLAPLETDKLYNVKVYSNNSKLRILEPDL